MKLNTAYNRLDKLADSFTPETIASTVAAVAFFGLEHSQVKLTKLTTLRSIAATNSSIRTLMQLVNKFTPIEWKADRDSYVFSSTKQKKIIDSLELDSLTLEGVEQRIYESLIDKPTKAPKFTALTDTWKTSRIEKFNTLATVDQQMDEIKQVEAYLQAIKRELQSKTDNTILASIAHEDH